MLLRTVTAVLVAIAATCGSALACKGPTLLFSDDFQTADPAWILWAGSMSISGGSAQLTSNPGTYANIAYAGTFVDSGDACVDMVAATAKDPTSTIGGIMFGGTDDNNFYALVTRPDGQAAIIRQQNGGWLLPVPMRAAPAVKTGAATNTLRVTWKGTDATAYINDQQFIAFKIQPFKNGMIGLYAEPEGNSYKFSNLKITNAP